MILCFSCGSFIVYALRYIIFKLEKMATRIVNKTLHLTSLPAIDNTDTVYIDCLIFIIGSEKQTPIELINNDVLQNCIIVYQPSTA